MTSGATTPSAPPAVVLDLDGSVGVLPGERRLALSDWQESIRYGCTLSSMRRIGEELERSLPGVNDHGTVLLGSGDFHHLSWPLIERSARAQACADDAPGPLRLAARRQRLRVLVLDNHPDNMRFPFGVHCGSWVRRVAMLPEVDHVLVVGITSADVGWKHAWENQLGPLRAGKLSCWSIGVDTSWARWLGVARAFRRFGDAESLTQTLCAELMAHRQATYLSIDKDVFATEVVRTNWDQGLLLEAQADRIIDALRGQIVGSDITGDVSAYRYRTAWKRWLSHADAQDTEIAPGVLHSWQADQHALNQRLVERIDGCAAAGRRAAAALQPTATPAARTA